MTGSTRLPDLRCLPILLALAAATPAVAVPQTIAPLTAAPPAAAQSVAEALARASERLAANDCAGALALLDPLVPGLTAETRLPVQLSRLPCLARVGRDREAAGTQAELVRLEPKNGAVRAFGVIFAVGEGRVEAAADQLAALAAEDPSALRIIGAPLWDQLVRGLSEKRDFARRDRTGLALARADWQPEDAPQMRPRLARHAIQALAREGKVAEAEPFLDLLPDPGQLFDLAIERQFAPLWPTIEARLGPNQGLAIDRYATDRLRAYSTAAGDAQTRQEAVRAFLMLGRPDDAAQIGDGVAIADGLSDEDVATVLHQSQALILLKRPDAAIARVRALAALDPARTPAAVSAHISLAETLDEIGRPEQALAAARDGLSRADAALSPYGKAWLKRSELCALSSLGRTAEAKAAADVLAAAAADNEAATIEGLLCAGQADRAAPIAIATLSTPDGAARIADQFQPTAALIAAPPSRLRDLWSGFLARRDVKAAFDRAARILPRPLWPVPGERPLPRLGGGGPIA